MKLASGSLDKIKYFTWYVLILQTGVTETFYLALTWHFDYGTKMIDQVTIYEMV